MKTALTFSAVALAALMAGGSAPARPAATGVISAQRLSDDIRTVSSDAFAGRGPATEGESRMVDWAVGQFKAMGLKPGGPHGAWTQEVPMRRFTVPPDAKLSVKVGDWSKSLAQGTDAVAVTFRPVERVAIDNAPMVFVGYGVYAPERHWDDFKGVDLKGKIAVVLVNDPDYEADLHGLFGGKAMTYYGRWTYKFEEAVRRGALGMLIVHETGPAGYGWTTIKNSNTGPQFDIVRKDPAKEKLLLQGWLQHDVAAELFRHAGLDYEALKAQAHTPEFRPVELKGARFDADYALKTEAVTSHNILARLPGTKRPDETVIYSAHWDHFGIGEPDASGDRVFHGAVDDGTGIAGVMELARAYAKAPRTDRSVLFALWTAEERGLLGSEYYGAHPVAPLDKTVADINVDIMQVKGPAHDVILVGAGKDTLEDMLKAEAKKHGRYVTPESHPEVGSFYRGDQFSFAKQGVPVLPLMANSGGPDLLNGGRAAGEAWVADYTANHYHRPADRWSADWDLRGAAADADLIYAVGRRLANSDLWPSWKPGSEFAAKRAETAKARKAKARR
ncbi:MAG: M28 family peptidase [Proteobacteria bacterium]|nr:M28 family peptidase [Pseudomonadota bacterium]